MTWTDETLMAFADGELADPVRDDIERAIAADAALRGRVAALRRQRARLAAAFAPVLDEPMPPRLAELLRDAEPPKVVPLDARRAARERPRMSATSWARWGGMAAALLLGVLLGTQLERGGPTIGPRDARLVAEGPIGDALSSQLASAPVAGAPVAVQLSFVDKSGRYCRTFSTSALAGMACRQDGQWDLQTLAAADPASATGMRQAASALPRAVLDAVDRSIAGAALDAAGERRARDAGWHR
ncbi:MAG TPA: hypothetical protein VNU48_07295 [Burkholderiaceae bacterium]|nr:hypothetical protein [Burkholderiaceae bacterium]